MTRVLIRLSLKVNDQGPQFNSIQFKALFRVDINHTYNTSSNELLKSTMVYNNTYNHTYKILNKNIHQFMQFNIDTSYRNRYQLNKSKLKIRGSCI